MALSEVYYLHGILLPNGTWIKELTDTTPATNTNHLTEYAAGVPVPSFRAAHGAAPDVRFTTPQVKEIIDACGMFGYDMSAGNCDLFYRRGQNLSSREAIADADHLRIRCVQALLYWESISARDRQNAEIRCRIIPTYDGVNAPIAAAGSTAIPAVELADEFFTLGPVKINTNPINGLQDYELNLNPTLHEEYDAGEDYPRFGGVQRQDPVLIANARSGDPWWETIGPDGLCVTELIAYLRRKQPCSVLNYGEGEAQHIKITATKGLATIEQSTGGHPEPSSTGIRVGITEGDASASYPLSINTASAIT